MRSPEETFLMQYLPPATKSHHIHNRYELNVNVKFNGWDCCSDKPSISIPLTIIPLSNPAIYGFPEPAGWAPNNLGMFKFELPGASGATPT